MDIPRPPQGVIFEQATLLDQAGNLTEGAERAVWLLWMTSIKRCVLAETDPGELMTQMDRQGLPSKYFNSVLPQTETDSVLNEAVGTFKGLGVRRGGIVVIGNDIESMQRAEAANLGFVAVVNGALETEDFTKAGLHSDLVMPSLTDMRPFFKIPRSASSF